MQSNPVKLSIITVSFNALDLLKGTAASIDRQKCEGVEYIVVDGKSTDGTLEYLQESRVVDRFISEPDKGLYDAMNKAIDFAQGQMIWFVNAGDQVYGGDTLKKIVDAIDDKVDVLYGEVMLVNENRVEMGTRSELSTQQLPAQLNWKSMRFGMVVCHQGFIVRKAIVPKYDHQFGLTSDIDWVINCLKSARGIHKLDFILSEYLQGGLSKQYFKSSMKSRFKVLKFHFGFLNTILAHIWILVRALLFKLSRTGKSSY
jgi:glycosyltransferase involved in cell wall biosynthesis